MKYLQILFFYVQDAALFKVHLPGSSSNTDNFVLSLLEFSPRILLIYIKFTNLCLSFPDIAITKILLSLLFRPTIMLILLLMCLGHIILSRYIRKYPPFRKLSSPSCVKYFSCHTRK